MAEDKMSDKDRSKEKNAVDTLMWMSSVIKEFADVLSNVASGNIGDKMEELMVYFDLKEYHEKLLDSVD